ncbi:MAG: crotonobetainyl-CoA--carnitine CoA-transferase, partial [Ilumatobacteraceae bacterium]|nr:crotonobetainyl-CoA--carnitine CoA-transferase [Ilumatobacteraceae bacterium]
ERGRTAVPVMRALAKWGMPLLEAPDDQQVIRPWTAVNASVATSYDPVAAQGVDERYLFRVDGEDFMLSSVQSGGLPRDTPDLVLESGARVWIDIRQGRVTMRDAIADGSITVTGPQSAIANLQRIFHLA